jgi:hypothetical protein
VAGQNPATNFIQTKIKNMITITTNHDWAKSVDDLRQGLLNTIETELEEYDPEDTGWSKYNKDELNAIVDRYLNEVTDEEIDEFFDVDFYGDRDEAIMCYLNEWAFHPDGAGY